MRSSSRTTYVKNATRDDSDVRRYDALCEYITCATNRHATVAPNYRNITWAGVPDPRVAVSTKNQLAFDNAQIHYFPTNKHTSRSYPVVIASFKEARLHRGRSVRANDDLATARQLINDMHTAAGIPGYDAAGTATQNEVVAQVIEERRREMFTEGGHRLNDQLRFVGTPWVIPFKGEPGSIHPDRRRRHGTPLWRHEVLPASDRRAHRQPEHPEDLSPGLTGGATSHDTHHPPRFRRDVRRADRGRQRCQGTAIPAEPEGRSHLRRVGQAGLLRGARWGWCRTAASSTSAATGWRISTTTSRTRRRWCTTSARYRSSSRPRASGSSCSTARSRSATTSGNTSRRCRTTGRRSRLNHLVHHTSGIRDVYGIMAIAGLRMEDVYSDSEAVALIARQKTLNFKPGDAYLYSNSGYFLLAQLVRRVTGKSLREFADERIFQPLGDDAHAFP